MAAAGPAHMTMLTPDHAMNHVRFDANGTDTSGAHIHGAHGGAQAGAQAGTNTNMDGSSARSKPKSKATPHPAIRKPSRAAAPTPALAPDRLYKIKSKLRAASYTIHGPDIKALFDLLDRYVCAL